MNTQGIFSPVSRHPTNEEFYLIYVFHDIFALIFTILAIIQVFMPVTRWHAHIGIASMLSLFATTCTGVRLIYQPASAEKKSILYICLMTQAFCVSGIFLQGFVYKYNLTMRASLVLIAFHLMSLYKGYKSGEFLHKMLSTGPSLWQLCLKNEKSSLWEMVAALLIPQVFVDSSLLIMTIINAMKPDGCKSQEHHQICIMFLLYIAPVGILFSFLNDEYWIFTPELRPPLYVKLGVYFLVYVAFLSWKGDLLVNCLRRYSK